MEEIFYILKNKEPKSIELPPVRRWDNLNEAIRLFKEYNLNKYFKLCNLPQNPLGIPSSDTAIPAYCISKELDVHIINHLPYRTENPTTYIGKLIEYSLARIEGLLLISGDIKVSDMTFSEAARIAKSFTEGYIDVDGKRIEVERWRFAVGAGLIPNRENETDNFISKVKSGAEFFQTQITLEEEPLKKLIKNVSNRLDNEIAILVGVIPNKEGIEDLIARLSGGKNNPSLKYSQSKYIDYLEGVLKNLLNTSDEVSTVNMGIHIYPIRWTRDNIEYVTDLISRF